MKKILTVFVGSALLGSCGVYKQYESQTVVPQDVYGVQQVDTTGNIANMGWREMFTDAKLQDLIQTALERNTEMKTAMLRIEQAEIGYKTSKLGYLPTVAFSPSFTAQKAGSQDAAYTGMLGIAAEWQLDVFGAGVTNTKRKAKAQKAYAEDYEQAVESRLVSSVASLYYNLEALDMQLAIQTGMIVLYEKTYESVQTLFEAGQYNSAAVSQTRAQLEQLKVQLLETNNSITATEHALCELLNEPYRHIERGVLQEAQMPQCLGTGVPADLLRVRPDVRAAERNIELAYYDVQLSKGNLYPSLKLSANGGWQFMNPTFWMVEGIGSLVQPIFMGGKLRADLKINKINQQIAVEQFRNTVIRAGHEVTQALADCELSQNKTAHILARVEALQQSVYATQELMNNGSSNYLEVLTALQELLQAQSAQVANKAAGMDAVVRLYAALGGK